MPRTIVLGGQRRVEVLELPHLSGFQQVAFFHEQFFLRVVDGQTLFTAAVPQLFGVVVVTPILVAFGSVARV